VRDEVHEVKQQMTATDAAILDEDDDIVRTTACSGRQLLLYEQSSVSVTRIPMAKKRPGRKHQTVESKRRMPRQARSLDTIEIIFEATARILQREGRAALNTNQIASRAGISIGTLYQYFQNKEAILLAMARREVERATTAVLEAVANESPGASGDPARRAIRALIGEFTRQRKARLTAFQTLVVEGFGDELETNLDEIAQALAARTDRLLPGRSAQISKLSAFILTRAVNGVLVSAANEQSPYLGTEKFEDELVRLVQGFLAGI
jgi:AcrR family transcriptional regulator